MLAIDVGNTNITNAIFDGDNIRGIFRISTQQCVEAGTYFGAAGVLQEPVPKEIVISSVRKDVTKIIEAECANRLMIRPFVVEGDVDMGIINLYKTKETLGIDRLVNASAGYHLYSKGSCPLVVIDLGTATTIDYITHKGEFLGGAIAPGLMSAYKGLLLHAPELPNVEISPVQTIIGKTTQDCIKSGVIASHAAMISEMANMMAIENGSIPTVIITGGLSRVIANKLPEKYVIDENLTLKGLSIIYNINNS
jgi:type III pantothenate kinase